MKRLSTIYVLGLLLLAGCAHKDLCYFNANRSQVEVIFEWDSLPQDPPLGMRLFFYPQSGAEPYIENLNGAKGGYVDVPVGNYTVVCVNNDTETILWRGENALNTLEAYTRTTELVENMPGVTTPKQGEEEMVLAPEPIWSDTLQNVVVQREAEDQLFVLYPTVATKRITYEVNRVSGSENITLIRATLSGLSGSLLLADREIAQTGATLPFSGSVDTDNSSRIVGEFHCFGYLPNLMQEFTLYCWSAEGNIKSSYDVTDQMVNSVDTTHIHLIIDGNLTIPSGGNDGSGFEPNVNEWIGNDHNILF